MAGASLRVCQYLFRTGARLRLCGIYSGRLPLGYAVSSIFLPLTHLRYKSNSAITSAPIQNSKEVTNARVTVGDGGVSNVPHLRSSSNDAEVAKFAAIAETWYYISEPISVLIIFRSRVSGVPVLDCIGIVVNKKDKGLPNYEQVIRTLAEWVSCFSFNAVGTPVVYENASPSSEYFETTNAIFSRDRGVSCPTSYGICAHGPPTLESLVEYISLMEKILNIQGTLSERPRTLQRASAKGESTPAIAGVSKGSRFL
ncbi:hypothetical protein MA16_Dca002432 [Dendrobium catenatum]|uniref:Uncharacterized protein n=1 Tax=Dendrobium catenatum TaxID=906689 RepID=A0A2I0W0H5_9ASPA|nr:hypothetical protein MA16_Dca002432 [Dendrobium catenatum]